MILLVTYIAIALGFSFLCSVLEAALLSITPSYLAVLEQDQPKVGKTIRNLKANIDRPLSAILSLNTIAHTVGAAGVGAEAQRLWGSEVLAITSAILTLLILVFSEIIPKTLGAVYWRRLTGFVARVLPPMILILSPFVWLSEKITSVMRSRDSKHTLSREEFAALARVAKEQGVFDQSESRILENLFRFGSLRTRDIMTPRTVMFALDEELSVRDAVSQRGAEVFSRIPIWRGKLDHVTGIVLKDQLLLAAARDQLDVPIRTLARDVQMVPEALALPALFERLLNTREHIAIVVDEYGGVDGVVTMEDVIETLIGLEIVDEADRVRDMRAMARSRWRERAKKVGSVPPPSPEDLEDL